MLQLRSWSYSCLLLQVALTVVTADAQFLDSIRPLSAEESRQAPKLVWPAVGDSVEVHSYCSSEQKLETMEKQPVLEAISAAESVYNVSDEITSNQVNNTCVAVNGRGITNLLKQARAIIPSDKIREILKNAATDPEVQALRQLIKSQRFTVKLAALQQSRDFSILKAYICRMLHFDIDDYRKFVSDLLHPSAHTAAALEEHTASPFAESGESKPSAGVSGLLQTLKEALPRQQLQRLYSQLLSTDEDLQLAVQNFKAPVFKQLLTNVRNLQDYKDLREMLRQVGLPVSELKQLLETAMPWEQQSSIEAPAANLDISIALLLV